MSFPAETQRRGEELICKTHPWVLSVFEGVNGFTLLKAFSLQPNPLLA